MGVVEHASDLPAGSVFVPTMGALHEGHVSLIRIASEHAERHGLSAGCVVSIYINPSQFNDPQDFIRYPRMLDIDADRCLSAGASVVYAPESSEVYPPHGDVPVGRLPSQAVSKGLEDAHRPGHFEGVVQVVRRLFQLVRPAAAVFGEKDWQQLQVIRAMSQTESLGVEILSGPIMRDPDGMAMSSRNRFLSDEERAAGLGLSRALRAAAAEPTPDAAEAAMATVLGEHGIPEPDYAVVRDAASLGPPDPARGRSMRAIVAARVGSDERNVRLLDNAPWPG